MCFCVPLAFVGVIAAVVGIVTGITAKSKGERGAGWYIGLNAMLILLNIAVMIALSAPSGTRLCCRSEKREARMGYREPSIASRNYGLSEEGDGLTGKG